MQLFSFRWFWDDVVCSLLLFVATKYCEYSVSTCNFYECYQVCVDIFLLGKNHFYFWVKILLHWRRIAGLEIYHGTGTDLSPKWMDHFTPPVMDDNSVCFLFLPTFGVVSDFSHSDVYLMCPKWYFFVVLLCISLMIRQRACFHVLTGHSYVASIYGHISLWGIQIFCLFFFFFQLGCVCCCLGYSYRKTRTFSPTQ